MKQQSEWRGIGYALIFVGALYVAGVIPLATTGGIPCNAPVPVDHGFLSFAPGSLTYSVPIQTTAPNVMVYMLVQMNTVRPVSVVDGGSWALVPAFTSNGVASLYYNFVPTAGGTSVVITVPDTGERFVVFWFDASGVPQTQALDPNPSLPVDSGPSGIASVPVTGSTSGSCDLLVAYDSQVSSCGTAPAVNSPFISLQGDSGPCGYSVLGWLAYATATSQQSGATWTPFTNTTPTEDFTTVFAIAGALVSTTTTAVSSSTTPTSTSTTSSTTSSSSTSSATTTSTASQTPTQTITVTTTQTGTMVSVTTVTSTINGGGGLTTVTQTTTYTSTFPVTGTVTSTLYKTATSTVTKSGSSSSGFGAGQLFGIALIFGGVYVAQAKGKKS
jgi:hypothetical protein